MLNVTRAIGTVEITGAHHKRGLWYTQMVGRRFIVVPALARDWFQVLEDLVNNAPETRHVHRDDCKVVTAKQPAVAAAAVSDAAMRGAQSFLKTVDEPGVMVGAVRDCGARFVADRLATVRVREELLNPDPYVRVAAALGVKEADLLAALEQAFPTLTHPLRYIFDAAVAQVASGKGNERHGKGADFMEQPWVDLATVHGIGFLSGQAAKKLREAQGFADDARWEREMLGVLVYTAMAITARRMKAQEKN